MARAIMETMKNINPNSLNNLKKNQYRCTWNNGKTRTIRVPVALADTVLDYARRLDSNENTSHDTSELRQSLLEILNKIEVKEKGYKSNASGQLIKDLRELLN